MNLTSNRRLRSAGTMALLLAGAFVYVRLVDDSTMTTEAPDPFGYADQRSIDDDPPSRDLRGIDTDLSGIKGGWTYAEYDRERDARSVDIDRGFGCLESCDGLAAGYWWARQNLISETIDCDGDSWPFQEGCIAYATERQSVEPVSDHRDGPSPL